MKKTIYVFFFISFFFVSMVVAKKLKPKDLPTSSRLWLTHDVKYIITNIEKNTFLQLETAFERQNFIKGFWKQRDPNPNTEENEYKIEHYRRIKYANKHYGKESPGPGWRSEMGRIYILLGKPNQVIRFLNTTGIYPTIIWFYSNLGIRGIPNSFNIVFFRPDVGGEYKLYSPVRYGPSALLTNYMGDRNNYLRAYSELHKIEHEVANISLSLLPEESGNSQTPSLMSELLVSSKIPNIPHNKAYDNYARNFINFKGNVRVSHMENYIKNSSMVKAFYYNNNYGFVHLLIEPDKLTIEKSEDFLYTTIEIHGNIYNDKNKIVYKYSKKVPIKMSSKKLALLQQKRFSFQDMFPLLTGKYRYNFLLMNLAGKEFTSIKGKITIPKKNIHIKIATLILANKKVSMPNYKSRLKPYVINGTQIVASPKNDFNSYDTLHIYTQLTGLTKKIKDNCSLYYLIKNSKSKKIVLERIKPLKKIDTPTDTFESFSLEKLPGAFYTANVYLKNKVGKILSKRKEAFYITIKNVARPWILSIPTVSKKASKANIYNVLGKQYYNLKQYDKSLTLFYKAYSLNTTSLEYAIDYIKALTTLKKYKKAKAVSKSLLNGPYRKNFLLTSAKLSFVIQDYTNAIKLFKEYVKYFGANIDTLNMLGECYIRIDDLDNSISTLQKSIKKKPQQPKIIATLNKLLKVKNGK